MDTLFKNISRMFHSQRVLINDALSGLGIGSGQYVYVFIINDHPGITQTALTAEAHVDKATTAKALKKLMDENIVEKIPDAQDRRYFRLYLTEKGKGLMPQIFHRMDQVRSRILAGVAQAEGAAFSDVLEKIVDNAAKLIENK